MAKYGKWFGAASGWLLGGPIGAILGFAVGSIFDSGTDAPAGQGRSARARTLRGDYAASLLVLVAAVMKADGRVMKSELDYVKRYFVSRFGEDTANEAVVMLRDILKQEIPLRDVSRQLSQRLEYSYRLEMLHFLFGIASADGTVSDSENDVIRRIANYMQLGDSDFQSIQAFFQYHRTPVLQKDLAKVPARLKTDHHPVFDQQLLLSCFYLHFEQFEV